MTGGYAALIRRPCRRLQLRGVSPELRGSVSYFASIVSANVAIATPNLAGVAGPKEKKAVQKVQAPAQPFIAFDPARPADDQSARRARRVFSCLPLDLYDWNAPECKRML